MRDSKTQLAVDLIRARGSARSDDIAQHVDIDPSNVSAMLDARVKSGELVMCKVERPGLRPINEYRISASGKPVTWRGERTSPAHRLAPPSAGPAPRRPSPDVSAPTPPVPVPPPRPKPAPSAAWVDVVEVARVALWCDGRLEMVCPDGRRVLMEAASARKVCEYLRTFDPTPSEAA